MYNQYMSQKGMERYVSLKQVTIMVLLYLYLPLAEIYIIDILMLVIKHGIMSGIGVQNMSNS